MANAPSFVEHALDLLSLLGPVQVRPMFGGHGLYAQGAMFALLDDDEMFFKTDAASRPRFLEAGCRNWVYPGIPETSYYRAPDGAHEDAEAMLPWARLGLDAALRLKAVKDAAARAKAARRAEREARASLAASVRPRRATARHPRRGSGQASTSTGRADRATRVAPAKKGSPARKKRTAPRRTATGNRRTARRKPGRRSRARR
jgi:DNA transformation protein